MPTLPRKFSGNPRASLPARGKQPPAPPGGTRARGSDSDSDSDSRDAATLTERLTSAMAMHRITTAAGRGMMIPNTDRFAAQWGAGLNAYWSRFDEALRDSWQNALALTRSEFVYELLRHRQWPVAGLSWKVEVDDPKDEDQKRAQEQMTRLVDAVPSFQAMRLYLSEDKWFGKYGSQVAYDKVRIDGKQRVTIVDHEPVHGDSIVYKYDKTPGVLVRTGWMPRSASDERWVEEPNANWVQPTDRGRALFLYDRFWRDHFIITNFEPSGSDFLFEGDKAAAIFGLGLRGRLYWALQNRDELRSWLYEALQRVGVNGMLYAFFDMSNPEAKRKTLEALERLIRDNVTAFPRAKGDTSQDKIEHIEPSPVGYDIIFQEIERIEESIRRAVLGQSLSSQAESTGMGSEVAELHRTVREHIIRYDATSQCEALNRDMIPPLIRFNTWEWRGQLLNGYVPFRMRIVYNLDKSDAEARSKVIDTALGWENFEVSKEQAYEELSLSPPKNPGDILKKATPPPPVPGMPGAPGQGQPPGGGPPGQKPMPGTPHSQVARGVDGRPKLAPNGATAQPKPKSPSAPTATPVPAVTA